MDRRVSRRSRPLALALSALLAMPLVAPLAALAQEAPVEQFRLSASYNVGVRIGPPVQLVVGAEGTAAPAGAEVAASLPPATNAQGRAPNHHLDVIVFMLSNGRPVTDVVPSVSLVLQADQQRFAPPLVPLQGGASGRHFGTNLYLPDGTYTVSVDVGAEHVVFPTFTLGAPPRAALPTAVPPASPAAAQPTPRALPNNGAAADAASPWPLVLGALLLAVGLGWRARRQRHAS